MEKDIVITEDIKQLIEIIAEQVHITWMEGRIKDGWTYGPERNDTKKRIRIVKNDYQDGGP